MTTYYFGVPPTKCELCKSPIYDTFVDGATTGGQWANMCQNCWQHSHKKPGIAGLGGNFGIGRGQLYKKQADGRWLKIAG